MGQLARLEKITLIRRRDCLAQRDQAFKAFIRPVSNKSDNRDYTDPLGSNKSGPPKAPVKPLETLIGPEALVELPVSQDPSANQYSQQNLDKIIQTFLHTLTGRSGDKGKAKTLDVYHNGSHIECYNFCQQYEDQFTTIGATGLNQIPFAAFFLWDQINFY